MAVEVLAVETTMDQQQDLDKLILSLCRMALDGSLDLEELERKWPIASEENPFFRQVHEDIEDAVEHLPTHWLTGKTAYKKWQGSRIYFTLYLDSVLLEYKESSEELLRCREFVLQEKELSEQLLRDRVKEYFNKSVLDRP